MRIHPPRIQLPGMTDARFDKIKECVVTSYFMFVKFNEPCDYLVNIDLCGVCNDVEDYVQILAKFNSNKDTILDIYNDILDDAIDQLWTIGKVVNYISVLKWRKWSL